MRTKIHDLRGLVTLLMAVGLAASLLILIAAGKPAKAVVSTNDENGPTAEHQDSRDHQTLLGTNEKDCQEIVFTRFGKIESVQEVAPSNLTVTESAPGSGRVSIQFNEYHCESIAVDDKLDNNVDDNRDERPTTVTLGSVRVKLPDGTDGRYLLWLGTDNPILAARYRQLGLPAEYLQHASFSATGTPSNVLYDFVGDGLDHILALTAPASGGNKIEAGSMLTLLYEGREGLVKLQFVNDELNSVPQSPTAPRTTVAIAPDSDIAKLLVSSYPFTIPVNYVRGGWIATVKILE